MQRIASFEGNFKIPHFPTWASLTGCCEIIILSTINGFEIFVYDMEELYFKMQVKCMEKDRLRGGIQQTNSASVFEIITVFFHKKNAT